MKESDFMKLAEYLKRVDVDMDEETADLIIKNKIINNENVKIKTFNQHLINENEELKKTITNMKSTLRAQEKRLKELSDEKIPKSKIETEMLIKLNLLESIIKCLKIDTEPAETRITYIDMLSDLLRFKGKSNQWGYYEGGFKTYD